MKMGIRKPNIKSSIKARTTGKAKRRLKKALIPGYGKKGMGLIRDPKKAAYNYVYHRTTVGVGDIAKAATKKPKKAETETKDKQAPRPVEIVAAEPRKGHGWLALALGVFFAMAALGGIASFELSVSWLLTEVAIVAISVLSFSVWKSRRGGADGGSDA